MARSSRRSARRGSSSSGSQPVFVQRNYLLLIVGLALIVIGFAAMRIDNQFQSIVSLYVAPLIILGGYLEVIYAILWRPHVQDEQTDPSPRSS